MRSTNPLCAAGLATCVLGVCAHAQISDQSFKTTSRDCSGVQWSDDVKARYGQILHACQSVESHKGVTYVKFSAEVLGVANEGNELRLAVKDGGQITVQMPQKSRLFVEGRVKQPAELSRGDKLNFYVPQSRVVAQFYAANQSPEAEPEISAALATEK